MAQFEAKSWGNHPAIPSGRCVVNLDESVLRMLEPAQHRRTAVQPTYHGFKYNMKPESIDIRKPGKVRAADPPRAVQSGVALDVEVESMGSNSSKLVFTAVEQEPNDDLDVFMVLDPATGEFTMYEADTTVVLTYNRSAKSHPRGTSQPVATPPASTPLPRSTPTPNSLSALNPAGSAVPLSRTVVQKPKVTKPKPKPKAPVKEPTPPPPKVEHDAEEGELELEPVTVPAPESDAMNLDQKDGINGNEEPEGILPWEAVPTTLGRPGNMTANSFNAADGPEVEEFVFPKSFGPSSRDPPRKTQPKSARSGGVVLPHMGRRDPPPPRPAPPPPEPEDEDDGMVEVVLPGTMSYDIDQEMAQQLGEESSEEDDDDEDDDEDEEEENEGGFDTQAFQQAMADAVDSSEDDDSSSEEDD